MKKPHHNGVKMSSDLTQLFHGEAPTLVDPVDIPKLDLGHDGFRPVTKRNVGYIVCGLAFDEDDNVLMMQVCLLAVSGCICGCLCVQVVCVWLFECGCLFVCGCLCMCVCALWLSLYECVCVCVFCVCVCGCL